MKIIYSSIVLSGLILIGCGGGDNRVDFTQFVLDEISDTADNTEPTNINRFNFVFNEREDAFDAVL